MLQPFWKLQPGWIEYLYENESLVFFTLSFLDFWKTCVFKVHGKPKVLTSKRYGSSYIQGQHFVDEKND